MSIKDFREHANQNGLISTILTETPIDATGVRAPRYTNTYIKPFIGKKLTHTLARDVEGLTAGSKVTVHSTREEGGKHFAVVSGEGGKKVEIPHNYMHKPEEAVKRRTEKGFEAEQIGRAHV